MELVTVEGNFHTGRTRGMLSEEFKSAEFQLFTFFKYVRTMTRVDRKG